MLAGALAALAVAWTAAATRTSAVRAAGPPPRVDSVSPTVLQRDGQPVKVTISGSRLSAVTSPSPVAPAPASARSATAQPAATAVEGWRTPVLFTALGLLLGALVFLLWSNPGRIALARRRGPLAQLVLRPVQRIRLGRICVHCGRLHLRWRTRRDLWKAGVYCSATCFVASQEADIAAEHGGAVAEDRLQGVLVNPARDAYAHLAIHGPPAGAGDAAGGGGEAGADPRRPPLGEDTGRGTATTPLFGQPAPLGLLPGSFSLPPHELQRELDRRHAEALHHSVELQRALDARFAADLERALQAELGDRVAVIVPAGDGPAGPGPAAAAAPLRPERGSGSRAGERG